MLPQDFAKRAPRSCSRLLWGVVALLITGDPAMSVTPGLQLEASSMNTRSQKECVPVQWDTYQHSSWTRYLDDQTPEYIMWQQFCIKNSTVNFTASFDPPKWSRQPYDLSYSEGRYHYDKTLHPYVTEDGRVCVNASITMYDLQGEIDYGDYKINVSTNCSSSEMIFQLTIDQCGIGDIPRPIQPNLEPLIVPEGSGQGALTWKYAFFGDNKLTDYTFHITKSGDTVCDESSRGYHDHFNCTRDTLGQCNVTITAHIQNYTHKDSGEYCAAAYPTGGPNPGNDSCLKLVVVQQPVVDPFPGSQLGLGGASLVFHISNYSKYVNIQFVKDERKIVDLSGDGYELKFQYDPLDNTTVTMTLHMTGNLKHAGEYTLCTSLVNDTSTRNCTTSVSVSKGLWIGEVVCCIVGALLFAIIIITVLTVCCYQCCCKKKQISGSVATGTEDAAFRPLLQASSDGTDSPEDLQRDSPWQQTSTPVWQQIPSASLRLNGCQLQKISELFTDWKPLARNLGLEEPTIAEIEEDHRTSKERKYQVLYTWSQRQGYDATLKALLQCVEFDCRDRELAQRIFDTLN